MSARISPDLIALAHSVDLRAVALKYGARLKGGPAEFEGPCPRCGGRDRFSINARKGVFHCRHCGVGGDVIRLVEHVEGCTFPTAIERLTGERPRLSPIIMRAPAPKAFNDAKLNLARADRIWKETLPIAGTDGESYLARRGIVLDGVPDRGGLRWHPECPWGPWPATKPCIIARYTDTVTAEPRGIWRRPLTGETPKALGPSKNCVIRLWPDDAVEMGLVLGEGVETTLAAATRITHLGALLQPAWAAGTAGNMTDFQVLPGIEALTLLVDHDRNCVGQDASEACARRWLDAGREVARLMPGTTDCDFNDLVMA